ncbi:MAG: tRNA dihydrouridine(20/20a) synthase DusA [Alphaproteobacteria bacterium]|jgi:tRNA-dihydrouridine synthase A|nr:tRNA dihydrouridine(20/20a) synthase DusA [Alphaproteobacteria bacterium]MDP7222560.1 tRNA dihydrouridine(20/20a) synthase DusA [Alphaproteobacteria bacterium]
MNQEQSTFYPYIAIAPMMDWTDRHCRYFLRLISPNVRLFTEMVTTGALIHGDRDRFLRYDPTEKYLALQLGGDDPQALATCAKMAEDYGYDEVNLNCGCPSDRVQNGNFGACLMAQPDVVARAVDAMQRAVSIPVTVKCRIAIDDYEERPFLKSFLDSVSATGCREFTIHARKAWLKGLSPKENRDIPPLNYDLVKEMKADYPSLRLILNGGIKTLEDTQQHLKDFDGVMIGREVYQNPYFLATLEENIFGNTTVSTRDHVARAMIPYIQHQNKTYGTPTKTITRHMIGLYHLQPGAKKWRRYISENAHKDKGDDTVIADALAFMSQ